MADWISVEDKLPEAWRDVIVYAAPIASNTSVFKEGGKIVLTYMHKSDKQVYWVEPWQHFFIDYRITHWKPMPEPPEDYTAAIISVHDQLAKYLKDAETNDYGMDEEYIEGWKSAMLVSIELINKLLDWRQK